MNGTAGADIGSTIPDTGPQASRFLWVAGVGMLLFVVGAFGAGAVAQPFRLARYSRPLVILHIVLLLGWMSLFIVQSSLALGGELAARRSGSREGAGSNGTSA